MEIGIIIVAVLAVGVAGAVIGIGLAGRRRSAEPEAAGLADRTDLANTQAQIQSSLDGMKDSLHEWLGKLAESQGQTNTQLAHIGKSHETLNDATSRLQKLLQPGQRGYWGERMAEDVIRAAGLQEGVNYRKQSAISNGKVPDITFLLPDSRVLHMDIKFPLDNYRRHIEGHQDLKKFIADVKAHIRTLAGRDYAADENGLGFVLMFLPVDSLFTVILQSDGEIPALAERHKVVLCSPTTLFPVLTLIRTAMDTFQMVSQSQEIVEAVFAFEREWEKYDQHVCKVAKQLATFTNSFDELVGARKKALERKVSSVVDLRDNSPAVLPAPQEEEEIFETPSYTRAANAA